MEKKLSVPRNADFKTKYFFIQMREEQFLEKKKVFLNYVTHTI